MILQINIYEEIYLLRAIKKDAGTTEAQMGHLLDL